METIILVIAWLSVLTGLVGLVWTVRVLVASEHYTPPKHKRRATYIAPKR